MHKERCQMTGKRRHPKRKQALTAANTMTSEIGIKLDVYKCPICGMWHLTKMCKQN